MDTIFSSKARIIPTYDKQDIEQCMSKFRLLILNNINDARIFLKSIKKTEVQVFSWQIYFLSQFFKKSCKITAFFAHTQVFLCVVRH